MKRLISTTGFALAALALAAAAQQPAVELASRPYVPQALVLRAEADLVQLSVVVRDAAGRPVYGLGRHDFVLLDNGQPRAITGFEAPSPPVVASAGGRRFAGRAPAPPLAAAPPQTVALFFDDYAMSNVDLAVARNAATKFFQRDEDRGRRFGIFTSSGVNQLDFTTDHAALLARVKKLGPHTRMPAEGVIPGGHFTPYLAQLINLNHSDTSPFVGEGMAAVKQAGLCMVPDECLEVALAEAERTQDVATASAFDTLAALRRLVNYMARQPGQRTILLVSTGFLTQDTQLQLQQVAEAALRAGVVFNSLDAMLLDTYPPGMSPFEQMDRFNARLASDDVMQDLAAATGGAFFTNNNDLAGALGRLAAGPEAAYRLSFAVAHMPEDSKLHRLKVSVPGRKHVSIQAREGYLDPGPPDDMLAEMPARDLDAALAGAAQPAAVPAVFGARWQRDRTGAARLMVALQVDARQLPFATSHGVSRQHLFFAAALYDAQGKFIAGREGALTLAFHPAQRAHAAQTGITVRLPIPALPGRYRLRALVREGLQGRITAFTRTVVIPR
ncbi:MAG: VWA domain-containing protein [Terriglobales bacterium]